MKRIFTLLLILLSFNCSFSQMVFNFPTGGEQVRLGEEFTISFTNPHDTPKQIWVYVKTPGQNSEQLTWQWIGAGSTYNVNYTFSYDKPLSDQYQIYVISATPYVYQHSEYFEVIPPEEKMILFNENASGAYWTFEETNTLNFYAFNITNIDVEYSLDGGETWEETLIIENHPISNGLNKVDVSVPYTEGTFENSVIRIKETGGETEGLSDPITMSSLRRFTFLQPSENEILYSGILSKVNIFNNYTFSNVSRYFLYKGETALKICNVSEGLVNGDNFFDFDVDQNFQEGDDYNFRFRIYDNITNKYHNFSSQYFSIQKPENIIAGVRQPNEGEEVFNFMEYPFKWTSYGVNNVDITLFYTYNETDFEVSIVENYDISNERDGIHEYKSQINIPDLLPETYTSSAYIVVSENGNPENASQSDNFIISQQQAQISSINFSEHTQSGLIPATWLSNNKAFNINWISEGIESVNIDYSVDNQETWGSVAENIICSNNGENFYTWQIPTDLFEDIHYDSFIRISENNDNSEVTEISNQIVLSGVPLLEFILPEVEQEYSIDDNLDIIIKNNYNQDITVTTYSIVTENQTVNFSPNQLITNENNHTFSHVLSNDSYIGSNKNYIAVEYSTDFGTENTTSDNFKIAGPQVDYYSQYPYYEFKEQYVNTVSEIKTIVVSGENLIADIEVFIPEKYYGTIDNTSYVTNDVITIPHTNGTIEPTIVSFFFMPDDNGYYDDNILIESNNILFGEINVSGWGNNESTGVDGGYNEKITLDTDFIDMGEVGLYDNKVSSFTINGENLNTGLSIRVDSESSIDNYYVSLDNINFSSEIYLQNTNLDNLTVYVKFMPTELRDYDFYVRLSGDYFTKYLDVWGKGILSYTPSISSLCSDNYFGTILQNEYSDIITIEVWGKNLNDDITVTAPTNFEVSTDGENFSETLTLPSLNGTVENTTIYTRFMRASNGMSDGFINIESQDAETINIYVYGQTSDSYISVFPTDKSVFSIAGAADYSVLSNTSWQTQSSVEWITINGNGYRNGQISVDYEINTGEERIADFVVTDSEELTTAECSLTQEAFEIFLDVEFGTIYFNCLENTYKMNVYSNVDWTIETPAEWLTVTEEGFGNSTVTVSTQENTTNDSRSTYLYIKHEGTTYKQIYVSQRRFSEIFFTDIQVYETDYSAGTAEIEVTSNTEWIVSSDADWFEFSVNKTSGNGVITIDYEKNFGEERFDYILIQVGELEKVITLIQGELTPELSVDPITQNVDNSAGTISFNVSSNAYWTAVSDQEWCDVTPSGLEDGTITANYQANEGAERTATITVEADGVVETLYLVQNDMTNVEQVADNKILIYPNPTSGIFKVMNEELTIDSITIYDITGKIIFNSSSLNFHSELEIDISNQPSGIYIVQIDTGEKVSHKRIIKK